MPSSDLETSNQCQRCLFGIASASSAMNKQYWGKNTHKSLSSVLLLS
ncbi:MAG: hypothetical protein DMF61_01480 [Blastocatellia bacterium AA13]|nr:MAG: hypothetical protein DMF61_01480 [Blastocatellia bacterium AA13]